jgi:hypothetical protein
VAALSRAAELAMVAYDPNAPDTQLLQGWLMHDRYLLRGAFGIPYEFLWANPYQPGLSYDHAPAVWHNAVFGRLFVRSSWDDEAEWFGSFDGACKSSATAEWRRSTRPIRRPPCRCTTAAICFGQTARRFRVTVDEGKAVFVVNLDPRHTYEVEVDDQELYEADTDQAASRAGSAGGKSGRRADTVAPVFEAGVAQTLMPCGAPTHRGVRFLSGRA